MAKIARLPIQMTSQEKLLGFGYAIASLFFLPGILRAINSQLINPFSSAWLNFLYFTLNFLFLVAILGRFLKRSAGFARKHAGDLLLCCLAGFSGYWLSNVALSFVTLKLFPHFSNPNDGSIAGMVSENFTIMAIGAVLFVPTAEELIHRGLIFGALAKRNRFLAYLISAAFFAAIHVVGYINLYSRLDLIIAFVQYLPAGLILAWAYERSGTIFAPIVIHMAINAMGIYAMR